MFSWTVFSWLFATLGRNVLMEVYTLKYSQQVWERLQSRFMSACFARSIELKRLLSHVKKKESHTMDHYLLKIKIMTDSLAAINSPVSNRELIEYAVLGLGRGYESLINTISYISAADLETLRPLLQAQEQRDAFLQTQDTSPVHQAFAAAQGPAGRGGPRGGAPGRGPGGRGGRGRGRRGRGGRGYYQQYPPYQQLGGAPPAYGGHPGQPIIPPRGPTYTGGFPSVENSYNSPAPRVICQLCFSPGHSALTCSRFTAQNTPALAALPTGETHDSVWYPDYGASAHMTPHE
ncbi:unnamed protein product, partial [Cuscuta europaea]